LVFIPLGFISFYLDWPKWAIFTCNFMAIIPMAWLIGGTTEQVDKATGEQEVISGLLNATFGNIVEMIICVQGIRHNQLIVVQCTLMGSILSNSLLVLGTALVWGGIHHNAWWHKPAYHQEYNYLGASASNSLMIFSGVGIILPTIFKSQMKDEYATVNISRTYSVLLLFSYFLYLRFQLSTHSHCFSSIPKLGARSSFSAAPDKQERRYYKNDIVTIDQLKAILTTSPEASMLCCGGGKDSDDSDDVIDEAKICEIWNDLAVCEDDDDKQLISGAFATLLLLILTILTSCCSEYLMHSIEGAIATWHVSKEFVGIIVLPIIGNAAEHYTAILFAGRDRLNMSLAVALGSACQMALFATPLTVLFGWVFDKNVDLNFHRFQCVVYTMSVLLVANVLKDGTATWLEGSILLTSYVAIAFIYFFEDEGFPVGSVSVTS